MDYSCQARVGLTGAEFGYEILWIFKNIAENNNAALLVNTLLAQLTIVKAPDINTCIFAENGVWRPSLIRV